MPSKTLTLGAAAAVLICGGSIIAGSAAAEASTACREGAISAPFNHSIPTAHRPGHAVTVHTTLTNKTGTTFRGVFFDYSIAVPANHNHWGPAPTVSWRWGAGSWHHLALARNHSSPDHAWYSEDHTLGTPCARLSSSTRTISTPIVVADRLTAAPGDALSPGPGGAAQVLCKPCCSP